MKFGSTGTTSPNGVEVSGVYIKYYCDRTQIQILIKYIKFAIEAMASRVYTTVALF